MLSERSSATIDPEWAVALARRVSKLVCEALGES